MDYNYHNYTSFNPNSDDDFDIYQYLNFDECIDLSLLQSTDAPGFQTNFEESSATWMGLPAPQHTTSSSDSHPVLSMDHFGQQWFPEPISHEPCDNTHNPYTYLAHTQLVEPVNPASHHVLQDYNVSPSTYYDTSNTGYTFNKSSYSTAWGLDVQSHTNPQATLHTNHIITGMPNYNLPNCNVMQRNRELGHSPTSGYDGHFPQDVAESYQYSYFSVPQNTQPESLSLEPTTTPLLYPALDMAQAMSPTDSPPLYFSHPDTLPNNISPSSSVSSLSPVTPTHDTPPLSLPRSDPGYFAPTPDPVSPLFPTYDTPSLPLPSAPCTSKKTQSPPKKRARKSPKFDIVFVPPVIKDQKDAKLQANSRRRSPRDRAAVRSQGYLATYFPNKGPCTLCKSGLKRWREDRALEHLVSTHILQVVKTVETFDEEVLAAAASQGEHLVHTEAQFNIARKYLNEVKCSLCPHITSLVFRESNFITHLENVHGKLPESTRKAELERLIALEPDKLHWYSLHDKFLYQFAQCKRIE